MYITANKPVTSKLAQKIASTKLGKTLFTKGELERFEAIKKGLPFPETPTYRALPEARIMNFMESLNPLNFLDKWLDKLVQKGIKK